MSDGERVDGDDMTYWWQALSDAGHFTVNTTAGIAYNESAGIAYNESAVPQTQTLYGTIHNGDVAGLSLVDVPQTYVMQTHAQRTDNALWHMASRIAELADKVRRLEQQLADMTADS